LIGDLGVNIFVGAFPTGGFIIPLANVDIGPFFDILRIFVVERPAALYNIFLELAVVNISVGEYLYAEAVFLAIYDLAEVEPAVDHVFPWPCLLCVKGSLEFVFFQERVYFLHCRVDQRVLRCLLVGVMKFHVR
jgi:hypothetical protein